MSIKEKKIPFSEEDIEKLMDDTENVFIEKAKYKIDILKDAKKITEEEAQNKNVLTGEFPDDMEIFKGCKFDEINDKIDKLSNFSGIKVDDLNRLFSEDTDVDINYETFKSYLVKTDKTLKEYVEKFVYDLLNNGFIEEFCSEYGEPGYSKSKDENRIITANWNEIENNMLEIIEENGFDIEWSDEWVCDYEEDKLYRSVADSYSWESSYFFVEDYEILGIKGNEEQYISTMINNPNKLLNSDVNLKQYGFKELEEDCHETGWYGRVENPEPIFEKFGDKYNEIVVQSCGTGQFAINWKVWVRNNNNDE